MRIFKFGVNVTFITVFPVFMLACLLQNRMFFAGIFLILTIWNIKQLFDRYTEALNDGPES